MTILQAYLERKAKEEDMPVEQWMTKTAGKAKTDGKGKKEHEKGDNVTLDSKDHKVLDDVWATIRSKEKARRDKVNH